MSRAPLLLLASGSPRRRELLEMVLGSIDVEAADIDETPLAGEQANDLVRRLAEEKAVAVAARHLGRTVIAADTVVVIDGEILGKPVDRLEAADMLRRLAGRQHQTVTGVAVSHPAANRQGTDRQGTDWQGVVSSSASTDVVFGAMADADIDWYLATGEADDKAGAYGIQGRAALFIEGIKGSYHNVMGLPLAAVDALMHPLGIRLLDFEQPAVSGTDE